MSISSHTFKNEITSDTVNEAVTLCVIEKLDLSNFIKRIVKTFERELKTRHITNNELAKYISNEIANTYHFDNSLHSNNIIAELTRCINVNIPLEYNLIRNLITKIQEVLHTIPVQISEEERLNTSRRIESCINQLEQSKENMLATVRGLQDLRVRQPYCV
jgi:hypothetical protein